MTRSRGSGRARARSDPSPSDGLTHHAGYYCLLSAAGHLSDLGHLSDFRAPHGGSR